jgi:hypothetical protein
VKRALVFCLYINFIVHIWGTQHGVIVYLYSEMVTIVGKKSSHKVTQFLHTPMPKIAISYSFSKNLKITHDGYL